tara:strand:- start:804 stop:1709 length:906 start_codon:yes stop_codon:yes gene_type:complete
MSKSPEKSQGNPEIGMTGSSFESASQPATGSKDFFNKLESQVNGGIQDAEATLNQNQSNQQVATTNDKGSNIAGKQSVGGTDWEKRYKDSSREAVKWREQYKQVEQFVPVLDAMKEDSGLVQHVREYLQGGGKPAESIQQQLKLGEDFIFDQHEAMTDPESDSARLMNAHVDGLVKQRVNEMTEAEQKRAAEIQRARVMKDQEVAFKTKHNMNDEDFESFKSQAKTHKMTLDDINYVLNKDKTAANVAQSTKKDMLNQMQNVRNMPTSASGANSQGGNKSQDREVFENILGFDDNVDNLFG